MDSTSLLVIMKLMFAVLAWGIIHSVTASLSFKANLRRIFGDGAMKFYRLFYNVFAVISFVPVLYLATVTSSVKMYVVPPPWSWLMQMGRGVSLLCLVITILQTDTLSFIGLRQLLEAEVPASLVVNGFYRVVRHPLYTFSLLVLWLTPSVTVSSFVFYIMLTIYILIGAYFEERKLFREFGQAYADYCSATPMIVPGVKFKGNK